MFQAYSVSKGPGDPRVHSSWARPKRVWTDFKGNLQLSASPLPGEV